MTAGGGGGHGPRRVGARSPQLNGRCPHDPAKEGPAAVSVQSVPHRGGSLIHRLTHTSASSTYRKSQ